MNLPAERSGTPPKDKRSLQAEPTPSHLLQQPDYQQLQVEAFGLTPGMFRRSARRRGEELVPTGGPRSLDGTLGQLTALRAPRDRPAAHGALPRAGWLRGYRRFTAVSCLRWQAYNLLLAHKARFLCLRL